MLFGTFGRPLEVTHNEVLRILKQVPIVICKQILSLQEIVLVLLLYLSRNCTLIMGEQVIAGPELLWDLS